MAAYDINGQTVTALAGKALYIAGDSIAYGEGSAGGYGKPVAEKYGMSFVNEAVSGATLAPDIADNVNGGTRSCICTTVTGSGTLTNADYILLEGGVNDAWNSAPVGTLTDGFDTAFDATTTIGSLETMLDYLAKNHSGKRVGFVFPHAGMFSATGFGWNETYKPAIIAALKKWGVPYLDIAGSTPPIGAYGVDGLKELYTADGTHPNEAGYERYYVDQIAGFLQRL